MGNNNSLQNYGLFRLSEFDLDRFRLDLPEGEEEEAVRGETGQEQGREGMNVSTVEAAWKRWEEVGGLPRGTGSSCWSFDSGGEGMSTLR